MKYELGSYSDSIAEKVFDLRDERIVENCLHYNAILLSADKSMTTFAVGREIFVIFV